MARRELLFSTTFSAVNSGNLPVTVEKMSINGKGCRAHSFAVHFCQVGTRTR